MIDKKAIQFIYILMVFLLGWPIVLHNYDFENFVLLVREDGFIEWASFWAFLLAGVVFGKSGYQQYQKGGINASWFTIGLCLFSLIVAFEEISWGQRLIGYRPPEYFLENNFQQEFNFHNIMATQVRKWVMDFILLGYGTIVPLLFVFRKPKKILEALGIISPPVFLVPVFILMFILLNFFSFKYSGEVIECALGLSFLYFSIRHEHSHVHTKSDSSSGIFKSIFLFSIVVTILGLINTFASTHFRKNDPISRAVAQKEIDALHRDFMNLFSGIYGDEIPPCKYHVRLNSYFKTFPYIDFMEFENYRPLVDQGMPEIRAKYFIDPWNSPYWIMDYCLEDNRRILFIYSFGPDRQRQSTYTEIRGDDVGKVLILTDTK